MIKNLCIFHGTQYKTRNCLLFIIETESISPYCFTVNINVDNPQSVWIYRNNKITFFEQVERDFKINQGGLANKYHLLEDNKVLQNFLDMNSLDRIFRHVIKNARFKDQLPSEREICKFMGWRIELLPKTLMYYRGGIKRKIIIDEDCI